MEFNNIWTNSIRINYYNSYYFFTVNYLPQTPLQLQICPTSLNEIQFISPQLYNKTSCNALYFTFCHLGDTKKIKLSLLQMNAQIGRSTFLFGMQVSSSYYFCTSMPEQKRWVLYYECYALLGSLIRYTTKDTKEYARTHINSQFCTTIGVGSQTHQRTCTQIPMVLARAKQLQFTC